jgi:hypothetical protein
MRDSELGLCLHGSRVKSLSLAHNDDDDVYIKRLKQGCHKI